MTVTIGIPTYNRPHWLRQSIESVLAQSIGDFHLVISDNASDRLTSDVVASFDDDRIDYVRSPVNVGMTNNFNRIIELADTDFLVILPDDDFLYSDYLASTLAMLERHPTVGVVHTGFDLVDDEGRVLERARQLVRGRADAGIERGPDLIDRAMRSSGLACWSSCLFRTGVIMAADMLRVTEEPFADHPLLMRIALDWDVAWIARPLAAVRMHEEAESAAYTSYFGGKYEPNDAMPRTLLRHRLRFLDEAQMPPARTRRYRRLAMMSYRRESVGLLSRQIGSRRGRTGTLRQLYAVGRSDPRMLLVPGMLKLAVALVLGRPWRP